LQHENLCRGLDYFEDKRKIYIVMEACSGGELFDQIVDKFNQRRAEGKSGSYSEAEAAGVLRQIFSGLQYMHERKIGHFDLKPDNFLFKDTQHTTIKIIDFGMSKLVGRTAHIKVLGGTLDYMAPEVIHTDYTYHADMWSMGVVTYVMLCGRCPFFRKKNDPKACGGRPKKDCLCEDCALCNRICEGKFSYPRNVPISEDAKDFISSLLQSDPAVRLTATEALSHPWLSGSASDTPLATSVLTDLQTMTQTSKLRTTLLEALSSDAFSDFEIKQLKASFEEMDADGDGKVSREEIKALQDSRPEFAQQLEQLLLMDVNGDGELDFEEILLAATQRKLMAKEDRIRNLFERLDEDGDGIYISTSKPCSLIF